MARLHDIQGALQHNDNYASLKKLEEKLYEDLNTLKKEELKWFHRS